MRKKALLFVFILFFLTSSVNAKTIKVISLDKFSTENPSPMYNVKTIEPCCFPDGAFLKAGTVISGIIIKSQEPRRGKRDGYIEFMPTKFIYNGREKAEYYAISTKIVRYKPVKPKKIIISTSKKVAGFIFKGATLGISFVEGALKAEKGKRIQSGLVKMYKDSPLSYIEVGKELNVNPGDILILKFKKNSLI